MIEEKRDFYIKNESVVLNDNGDGLIITLDIYEGPKYFYRNISWDGNLESNSGEDYTFPAISIASVGNENISWISGELTSSSDLVSFINSTTSWIYMNDDPVDNQEPLIINVSENAIFGDGRNFCLVEHYELD